MLAERRKKVRYILNPIKKPLWTTDSNGIKFGKGLMEKMGWSAGKGLGVNEQGIQEPIRVFSKNDTRGMGYKKNEENWMEHQDEFNFLLKQLSSNTDNNSKIKEAKISEVQSLEEKSKLSKARVHYQKFTRGKDLSKYSENDLSCILGIGKMKKTKSETTAEKEISYGNNLCETSFGITTISSGSIKDYFKKKWTANNLNFGNLSVQQFLSAEQEISENPNADLKKKSKKKDKEKRNEFLQIENKDEGIENKEIKLKKRMKLDLEEEIPRKRIKNSSKFDAEIQKGSENPVEIGNILENISGGCIKNIPKYKEKKKKKKREHADLKEIEIKYQSEGFIDEKINKEKKKSESEEMSRNRYDEDISGNVMEEEAQNETQKENLKKTRKKEKKMEKLLKNDNNYEREVSEGAEGEKLKNISKVAPEKTTSRKKKVKLDTKFQTKNRNNFEEQQEDQKSQLEDEIEEELVKKRKKEKKKEEIQNAEKNGVEILKSELNIGKKKKKKKEKELKSMEWNKEQINEDFLELKLGNQMVEEKSVKKKKKCLEELKEEEFAAAAPLIENKQKIYAETESQPEEVRKKNGKKKKKKVEYKVDQLQENILEREKMSNEKKDKNESESHLDTSGIALGIENEINKDEKENKSEKADFTGETGETMIHTHKMALFYMKKPFSDEFKNCSTAKVLNLIFGAEIERFKGANLGTLPGYGYKKN